MFAVGKDVEAGLAELALQLSLRTLTQQEEVLKEMRSRTGTLIAAASLAASFLGAQVASRGALDTLSTLALVAFACTISASIWILLPKGALAFELRGTALTGFYEAYPPHSLPAAQRQVAGWVEEVRDANQATIEKLSRYYTAASLALVAQIMLWVLEVSAKLA
jgi:hypothetical protein